MLILTAFDDATGAATLFGATTAAQRVSLPFGLIEPRWAEAEPTVRGQLGEPAFDECLARGAAMPIDDLVSFTLERLRTVAGA
jgi:hypothetical protein